MTAPQPSWLIVNADDYGCFAGVSRGILNCARDGIVTATGVFANARHFPEHAAWLHDCATLDTGVHLNLTDGEPLTADMRQKLSRWSGHFPRKYQLTAAVLSGSVSRAAVRVEWKAQIERCLEHGLHPCFLNSHEHIHMLPTLFPVACELAASFGIAHVRLTTAGQGSGSSPAKLLRRAIIASLAWADRRIGAPPAARFLGLESSGRLDAAGLERELQAMQPGEVHELMCHPGLPDNDDEPDERLRAYHDWALEHATLSSPDARALLHSRRIRLIGYRHLEVRNGRLAVRAGAEHGV